MDHSSLETVPPLNELKSKVLQEAYEYEPVFGTDLYETSPFINIAGVLEELYFELKDQKPLEIEGVAITSPDVLNHLSPILDLLFESIEEDRFSLFNEESGLSDPQIGRLKINDRYLAGLKRDLFNTPIERIVAEIDSKIQEKVGKGTVTYEDSEILKAYEYYRKYLPVLRQIIYDNWDRLDGLKSHGITHL